MQLTKMKNKIRNDFTGVYVCEFCKFQEESYGYDDNDFHRNVIPKMKCKACKKSTNEPQTQGENQ